LSSTHHSCKMLRLIMWTDTTAGNVWRRLQTFTLWETEKTGNRAMAKKFVVSDSCIHYKIGVTDRLFVSKKSKISSGRTVTFMFKWQYTV
jgi:hypothetical protein